MMQKVYFGLGSNLGDKAQNIAKAIEMMKEQIGTLVSQSALYTSEPWGFESENDFVNIAACFETDLSPQEVLSRTQAIERAMGRKHKSQNKVYTDRIIDIDILLYGNETINEPNLTIPHPLMHEREFVMKPLSEIVNNT